MNGATQYNDWMLIIAIGLGLHDVEWGGRDNMVFKEMASLRSNWASNVTHQRVETVVMH